MKIEMVTQQQQFIEFLLLDSSLSHEDDSPNKRGKQDKGLSGESILGILPVLFRISKQRH